MYSTSDAYKEEQKQALREKSYVFVNMGVINDNAKNNATASQVTAYSSSEAAFRGAYNQGSKDYATLESDFTKVNDTCAFLPRSSSAYSKDQGLISTELDGTIHITFDSLIDVDIKGLTIDFGDTYPPAFTITNGTDTYMYTKNNSDVFTCEDTFDNCEYLDIMPYAIVNLVDHEDNIFVTEVDEIIIANVGVRKQRLRIHTLEFGVGLSFTNEDIISTQRRNVTSYISEALPQKSFDFTINNVTKRFSQDNPKSFAHYIIPGQIVEFSYGRDIVDSNGDTHIEYIPGGKTYIKSWSSTDLQAKICTVGRIDMMDGDYYKGTFSPIDPSSDNNRTAYDVAKEIFTDAGFENNEYEISDKLKSILMPNPMPISTHKACLQMIANATRSMLLENRDGKISLINTNIPGISDASIIGYGTPDSPHTSAIVNENAFISRTEYEGIATLENGFTRVDDTLYFPNRTMSENDNAGIITAPGVGKFTLLFNKQFSMQKFEIEFDEILPRSLSIVYFRTAPWKNDVHYNVGDYVDYHGIRYRCIQAHTDHAPTNQNYWYRSTHSATPYRSNTQYNKDDLVYYLYTTDNGNKYRVYKCNRSCKNIPPDYPTSSGTLYWSIYYEPEGNLIGSLTVSSFNKNTSILCDLTDIDALRFNIDGRDSIKYSLIDDYDYNFVDEDGNTLIASAGSENRIHIKKLLLKSSSGYTLTKDDLMEKPTANSLDTIKKLDINYYQYNYGSEVKQIASATVVIGTNIIKLSAPASDFTIMWDDGAEEWQPTKEYHYIDNANFDRVRYQGYTFWCAASNSTGDYPDPTSSYNDPNQPVWKKYPPSNAQITTSGAYYVEIEVSEIHNDGKMLIYGKQMVVGKSTYSRSLHDIGQVKTLSNVLIDDVDKAELNADWLEEYFDTDTEYSVTYRGEPALDCNDLIYLESPYVEENLCRIQEEEINTSVGMNLTNNMKLRRISYRN